MAESEAGYLKYYDLESYLLGEVAGKFGRGVPLSVEEFFCIIVWKSNRSKSTVATHLKRTARSKTPSLASEPDGKVLAEAVSKVCSDLFGAKSNKEKFDKLMEWGFSLAIASAILSILYQNEFTVYDYRACQFFKGEDFEKLANLWAPKRAPDRPWVGYERYIKAVRDRVPQEGSLRVKDRWLWARSFVQQHAEEAEQGFPPPPKQGEGSQ